MKMYFHIIFISLLNHSNVLINNFSLLIATGLLHPHEEPLGSSN